jgi:signal peptidase I
MSVEEEEERTEILIFGFVCGAMLPVLMFVCLCNLNMSIGTSMLPTIQDGDISVGYRVPPFGTIKNGSVICYTYNSTLSIMHRIVAVAVDDNGTYYVTQGDGNFGVADPWKVRPSQVTEVIVLSEAWWPFIFQAVVSCSVGGVISSFSVLRFYQRHAFKGQAGEIEI